MPPSMPLTSLARATRAAAPRRLLPRAQAALLAGSRQYQSRAAFPPSTELRPLITIPAQSQRTYSTEKPTPTSAPSRIWSFEELQDLTQSPGRKVTIIDVREPSELQHTGKIPGAINIPITSSPDAFFISAEEFEDRFGFPRPAADGEAVFYCKAGVRSRGAAGLARDAGWTRVGEYPGSWMDWEKKGGQVEK